MLGHFKMDLKAKAEQYFETFSSKDLDGLASMFTDDIRLRDWTGDATGKGKVLTANQDIFDAVDTIQVTPLTLYQAEASLEDNTVIAEIEIEVNGDEKLMVVDVIDYDDNGLITSIRAYKG
jgi:ketosteroid isomerase-like protein